jgi:hypothetical protein
VNTACCEHSKQRTHDAVCRKERLMGEGTH